ncbi:MAG TPA: hypothetical protein VFZ65_21645 [Planctomycetota bacterium]|nr:hypothetical protein [Planctomycetota bacterium]
MRPRPTRKFHVATTLLDALVLTMLGTAGVAQDQVRAWGPLASDSEVYQTAVVSISASTAADVFMVVTADGRILANGVNSWGMALPPLPPAGTTYVEVSAGTAPLGLLSDGTLVQWGQFATPPVTPLPPPLPPGVSWRQFFSSDYQSYAVRSDGILVSWGTNTPSVGTIPTLAPGLTYESVTVGFLFEAALVSDGTLRVWGTNLNGVFGIPALPPGVTYTKVQASGHLVALRSDGQLVAWGNNALGQCNVPPLPAGMFYTDVVAGGGHTVAQRSDGQWLAWGNNNYGQCNIPARPPGTVYLRMAAGSRHTVALRSDGRVESWGLLPQAHSLPPGQRYRELDSEVGTALTLTTGGALMLSPLAHTAVPVLPNGLVYEGCSVGWNFYLGRVSDGTLRAWGDNTHGQIVVPPLPPGVNYVSADANLQSAIALRSDGTAVAWGDNQFNQNLIPALPPGTTYVDAAEGGQNAVLLRSDGAVIVTGVGNPGMTNVPALPPGLRYTQVACGQNLAVALRSDGTLVRWGGSTAALPTLPAGLSYVEVECGQQQAVARRSDGAVVSWGGPYGYSTVPQLPAGRSFLRIGANYESSAALIGSTSRYVPIGSGCSGSLPATRLVPRDTPQLGRTLPVLLDNLPLDSALMVFGWDQLLPGIPLAAIGMPGCTAHVSLDAAAVIVGSGGNARFELAIPYDPLLLGLQFYNQALVFDPGAGNPFSAVVSEAMEGVIGG